VVVDLLHNPAGVTMLGHVVKKKKKKKSRTSRNRFSSSSVSRPSFLFPLFFTFWHHSQQEVGIEARRFNLSQANDGVVTELMAATKLYSRFLRWTSPGNT